MNINRETLMNECTVSILETPGPIGHRSALTLAYRLMAFAAEHQEIAASLHETRQFPEDLPLSNEGGRMQHDAE